MSTWQNQERLIIQTYKIEEISGRDHLAPLGCRYGDDIIRHNTLNILFRKGLYHQGESLVCTGKKEKRGGSPDENDPIKKTLDHASSTSSDWQDGHIGRLPTVLNFSPQVLQI